MNGAVEETLVSLLSSRGVGLASHERRLEGLLRDLHPEDPLEVSVLLEAVTRGVVAQVLSSATWPSASVRASLVAALTEGSGLGIRPAEWAVGVWCRSLLGERVAMEPGRSRQRSSLVRDRPGSVRDVLGEGTQR